MTIKIILYIGANNKTKKITNEYEQKIEEILARYWEGFTLSRKRGRYEGNVEESIEAIIYTLQLVLKDLEDCINELKVTLVQEKVGCEITMDVDFKLK